MSSSDEDITKNTRNISTTQYSPQLRPHSSLGNQMCQYCNMNQRMLKNSKSNLQIMSKSQYLQDTYFGGGGQNFKFKKIDYTEYERKMKKAGKEIERLNRIIADQSIELEALNFVKAMSQFEVDTVVIQENQKLKKEIEDLQNQLNLANNYEQSQADNSDTFNYWNERKDSEKMQIDLSNLDLDDNGEINNDNFTLDYGIGRIDDIKKLLVEEYKFYKHLQSEVNLIVHLEEYTKKRHELLAHFQRLQHTIYPLYSPINEKKIINISRKQSVFMDDYTPQNRSAVDVKFQNN